MIKYVCVFTYPPYKKGDVVDVAPPGSGNAFVPKHVSESLFATIVDTVAKVVENPASVVIKSPRPRFTPSQQEPE